jgi:hypothetical protein
VQLVENKVVVQTLVAAAVARPAVVLVVVMRVMELQDMWLMLASTVVVVAADLGSLALVAAVVTEVLVLSAILALGSYAAFVKLLGLQFPVWPAFITG